MDETTTNERRAMLDDLLTWYPGLPNLTLEEKYQPLTHVAHGWYMRCHRSVQAVLVLDDADLYDVAAPVRRCLVEHTVALQWLATEGDTLVPVIRRHHQHGVEKLGKALNKADWKSVDMTDFHEILAEVVQGNEQQDTNTHFAHQAEKYGTPHDLTVYLAETRQSHPGWESASSYFDRDDESMLIQPDRNLEQADACLPFLLQALDAMNDMMKDHPWTAQLVAAGERVGEMFRRPE